MKSPLRSFPVLWLACAVAVRADYQIAWQEEVAGTTAQDCALADIDGDGDIDAVVVHHDSPANLLLNDGSGSFSPAVHAELPTAGAVGFADLNGDTHPDLLFAGHFDVCRVWLNNGSGTFSPVAESFGGSKARRALALADVNGDAEIDAILPGNSFDHPSEVWFGDGDGTFTNSGQQLDLDSFTTSVTMIDLDGQNGLDIVFGANGKNTIWRNNGSGIFTDVSGSFGLGFQSTFDIQFGDLNADGRPDAFVANGSISPGSGTNEVWLQNPDGSFTKKADQLFNDNYSFSVVLKDVDLDGDLDAVVGNHNGIPNEIWLNNGNASFTLSNRNLGVANAFRIRTADLDGDSDTDYFLTVNGNPHEIWISAPPAQGGPIKDSGDRIGSNRARSLAKGDFNGDGHMDIVMGNSSGVLRLLRNTGTGQFIDSPQTLGNGFGNSNGAVAAGDLDGDGDIDLFVGNTTFSANGDLHDRVWLNNGNGIFTAGQVMSDDRNAGAVALLDADNDGDLDVIVANMIIGSSGQNQLLLNNGNATFTATDAFGAGSSHSVELGDINGDGRTDVFIGGGRGSDNIQTNHGVWINQGNGTFTKTGQDLASGSSEDVALFDMDGDGDLDAFCTAELVSGILWRNNGNSTFSLASQNFPSGAGVSATPFDYDGDGDLDLLLGFGASFAEPDRIYLNDGAGNFSFASALAPRGTRAVVSHDFNSDGDLDLFIAAMTGDHVLLAEGSSEVQDYAASFGLSGSDTDPFEDPDNDGVLNFEEMAFNMNPNLADAATIGPIATSVKGLPRIRCEVVGGQRIFTAETIRRINPETLEYRLEAAEDLMITEVPPGVTSTSTPLNANYERATYQWIVPGPPLRYFGRFRVAYSP
jgi:hypothetical protein